MSIPRYARERENGAHPSHRQIGIANQSGAARKLKQLGQVNDGTRPLLAAEHLEMILVPVDIGEKDHAGLIGVSRRFKKVTRESDRWPEDFAVSRHVAIVERA